MQIIVNGVEHEVSEDTNVIQLLEKLDIKPERIALEINLTVINREDYHSRTIHEGDQVEIISFIGGGEDVG